MGYSRQLARPPLPQSAPKVALNRNQHASTAMERERTGLGRDVNDILKFARKVRSRRKVDRGRRRSPARVGCKRKKMQADCVKRSKSPRLTLTPLSTKHAPPRTNCLRVILKHRKTRLGVGHVGGLGRRRRWHLLRRFRHIGRSSGGGRHL